MIAQTPVRVLCGTIARCKTPFSNRVLHAVPPRSLQSYKDTKTRSHTDGFQRNNAKCLDEKGISRFVPHSSI